MADVAFVVRSDGIAALMAPGGDVGRWMRRKSQEVTLRARRYAPARTGGLRASIHTTGSRHVSPFVVTFEVRAESDHALFVHEGTRGPIMATHHRFMVVRPAPHSYYSRPTKRKRVRGQRSNPFLTRAMFYAMRSEVVVAF
jgi:hypothetical protein